MNCWESGQGPCQWRGKILGFCPLLTDCKERCLEYGMIDYNIRDTLMYTLAQLRLYSLFITNSLRPSSCAGNDGVIKDKQIMYIRGPYHVLSWHYRDIYRRILDTTSWHHQPCCSICINRVYLSIVSHVNMNALLDIYPDLRAWLWSWWPGIEALLRYWPLFARWLGYLGYRDPSSLCTGHMSRD